MGNGKEDDDDFNDDDRSEIRFLRERETSMDGMKNE